MWRGFSTSCVFVERLPCPSTLHFVFTTPTISTICFSSFGILCDCGLICRDAMVFVPFIAPIKDYFLVTDQILTIATRRGRRSAVPHLNYGMTFSHHCDVAVQGIAGATNFALDPLRRTLQELGANLWCLDDERKPPASSSDHVIGLVVAQQCTRNNCGSINNGTAAQLTHQHEATLLRLGVGANGLVLGGNWGSGRWWYGLVLASCESTLQVANVWVRSAIR